MFKITKWATHWKNSFIDKKAECDDFNNYYNLKVLKSSMVGSNYYAAVMYSENSVKAVMCTIKIKNRSRVEITRTREDEGIEKFDCPKSIIKLLSPTDDPVSIEWREKCLE